MKQGKAREQRLTGLFAFRGPNVREGGEGIGGRPSEREETSTARARQGRKAREAVARVLGGGWKVEAFGEAGVDFETRPSRGRKSRPSAASAWEKT